jgi:hypothetical protein
MEGIEVGRVLAAAIELLDTPSRGRSVENISQPIEKGTS